MELSAYQIVTVTYNRERVFTKLMERWNREWQGAAVRFFKGWVDN